MQKQKNRIYERWYAQYLLGTKTLLIPSGLLGDKEEENSGIHPCSGLIWTFTHSLWGKWGRFYKNHHQYILEAKPNFTPSLELPFLCRMQLSAFITWHFIKAALSVSTSISWCSFPQSNPAAEGSKEQKVWDKSWVFHFSRKVREQFWYCSHSRAGQMHQAVLAQKLFWMDPKIVSIAK